MNKDFFKDTRVEAEAKNHPYCRRSASRCRLRTGGGAYLKWHRDAVPLVSRPAGNRGTRIKYRNRGSARL